MKVKKAISIILLSCLFINTATTSFAGVLSEDRRYETFEGNNINIDNILEEDKVDVEIEGNTLVSPMRNAAFSSHLIDVIKDVDKGKVVNDSSTGVSTDNNYYMVDSVEKKFLTLKSNTVYTVFISGKVVFGESNTNRHIVPFYRKLENGVASTVAIKTIGISQNTYFNEKICFTTVDKNIQSFGFYISGASDIVENVDVYYHIIEGDWTNQNAPDYFEGIKSVGQNDENINSNLKLKNIPGNENLIVGSDLKVTATKNQEAEIKNITLSPDIDLQSLIGETLTLSFDIHTLGNGKNNPSKPIYGNESSSRFGIHLSATWKSAKNSNLNNVTTYPLVLVDNKNISNKRISITETITPPSGYDTLINLSFSFQTYRMPADDNDEVWYLARPKLEYGDKATTWIPNYNEDLYQEYIRVICLNEPLRSLSDDVKDKIIKKDGGWYIERNCGEMILDGNEEWYKSTVSSWQKQVYYTYQPNALVTNKNFAIHTKNDKIEDVSVNALVNNNKYGVNLWNLNNLPCIMVDIENISSIDELKLWLKDNPITVVYPLNNVVYEPLNIDLTIDIYLDATRVSNDSIIPAKMKVTVDRAANRALEYIELAKENPTIENISQARYWSNLMKESTLKDEFQNEINANTDITDLSIEKKTASANADMYIKMKNSLSLSLDTNSITFENFNASEDLEMRNAVNLTVSSSLPYKVNAYLEDELYNSDKSAVIDKSVLNIKNSSDKTRDLVLIVFLQ